MAMTILVIGTILFVCIIVIGLFAIFDSEAEPEWYRETPLLPIHEEVMETTKLNIVVAQDQSSTMCQPKVMQVIAEAIGRKRVA